MKADYKPIYLDPWRAPLQRAKGSTKMLLDETDLFPGLVATIAVTFFKKAQRFTARTSHAGPTKLTNAGCVKPAKRGSSLGKVKQNQENRKAPAPRNGALTLVNPIAGFVPRSNELHPDPPDLAQVGCQCGLQRSCQILDQLVRERRKPHFRTRLKTQ